MRTKRNPLKEAPNFNNISGKCAVVNISFYFNWDFEAAARAFKLSGYDIKKGDGASFIHCKRVIETGALLTGKRVLYTSNKKKLNLKKFLKANPKGEFILNQDGHVAVVKNSTIIDGWDTEMFNILGWWEIFPSKKAYERALSKRIMKQPAPPAPAPAPTCQGNVLPILEYGRQLHESILGI